MAWQRGQAYGQDLRDRVLAAPGSIAQVAARFGVSASYVSRARARRRGLGLDTPGAQRNHVPLKLAGLEPALVAHVVGHNHATIDELRAWAAAQHGVAVSHGAMHKVLARLGLTLKKRRSPRPSAPAPM